MLKSKFATYIKYILYIEFLIILIGYFIYISILNNINVNSNYLVILTFSIIGIFSIYNLIKTYNIPYSINQIHWLFIFIFMFLAPLYQYLNRYLPWETTMNTNYFVETNFIIIIWCITYQISYSFNLLKIKEFQNINNIKGNIIKIYIYLGSILSLFILIYYIKLIGFSNLLTRARQENSLFSLNYDSSIIQLISVPLKAIPILILAITLLYKNFKHRKLLLLYLFIINIILNNPVGSARFWAGSVWIGILIIVLKNKLKNYPYITYIILFGLILVFPIINIFRYNNFQGIKYNIENIFLSGDFDAYTMLYRTIIYVKAHSITYGHQLLGVILFFIPRSIWPNKPMGTGGFIAINEGLKFINLSSPIQSEAYINYGIFGVILFAYVLGKVVKKLDRMYWIRFKNDNKLYIINILYPFLLGFVFYNLRGSLISTFAYTIGFIFPIFFLYVLNFTSVKL